MDLDDIRLSQTGPGSPKKPSNWSLVISKETLSVSAEALQSSAQRDIQDLGTKKLSCFIFQLVRGKDKNLDSRCNYFQTESL